MEQRILGKTGLPVSVIGIGGWQLAGPVTIDGRPDGYPDIGRDAAVRLIRTAGELGVNYVDTAPIYGDGEGERRVGAALAGQRERWVVATKFGMSRGERGQRVRDAGASAIRPALEASLRRLNSDYVDVYMFHSPPSAEQIDAAMGELVRLKEHGLIRHAGVSTADAGLASRLSAAGVAVVLYPCSLLTDLPEMRATIQRERLGGVARGVFERGRLRDAAAGAATPQFAPDDIRALDEASRRSRCATFDDIAAAAGGVAALAVRYVLDSPEVHAIAIGGRRIEQFRAAAAAAALPPLSAALRRMALERGRRAAGGGLGARLRGWARSLAGRLAGST